MAAGMIDRIGYIAGSITAHAVDLVPARNPAHPLRRPATPN
jgi:hypothetical protein